MTDETTQHGTTVAPWTARLGRIFSPDVEQPGRLWPRWLFLRALGLIFLSAFYALAFQIHGLIGERGILPAGDYLAHVDALSSPRCC
jgi:hypothetical protein